MPVPGRTSPLLPSRNWENFERIPSISLCAAASWRFARSNACCSVVRSACAASRARSQRAASSASRAASSCSCSWPSCSIWTASSAARSSAACTCGTREQKAWTSDLYANPCLPRLQYTLQNGPLLAISSQAIFLPRHALATPALSWPTLASAASAALAQSFRSASSTAAASRS